MTVIQPNSVAGINSITVQSGNSLAVHKANGELIRTITSNSGVSTFSSISVGTAATTNSAGKSINIGLGASISQHSANTLSLGTGGDERVLLNGNGFLGIGTATVSAPLHVYSATNNTIARLDSGDATCRLQLKDSAGEGFVAVSGDDLILANTSSITERLRIDSSGRILKGLTTARGNFANNASGVEYGFQIEGTTGITAGLSIIRNSNDANDGGIVLGKTRATSTGGNTVVQAGDDLGNLTFAGSDGTSLQFGAEIFAEVQTGVGNDDLPTDLIFKTNGGSTSTTERLRINSSGSIQITPEGSTSNPYMLIDTSGDSVRFSAKKASGNNEFRFLTQSSGTVAERLRIGTDGALTSTASNNGQIIHYFKNTDTTSSSSAMTVEHHFNFNRTGGGVDLSAARIVAGKEREWVGSSSNQDGFLAFYTCENETVSERVRIKSDGSLFMGKTTQSSGTAGIELYKDGPNFMTRNGTTVLGLNNQAGTNGDIMRFYFQDAHRGNLNFSGGTFSATTASDYRLKENDTPITDGITRVKQLKPIRFNFKDNPSETLDGFFAHELQEVVPDCVTGEKDGAISERGEGYQCISKEGLVPLLTAALQEALTKIETLETKVAALEGG